MISMVAKVLNLIALFVHRSLLLASFVGKIIVASIAGVSNAVLGVFENILTFLQIVYEDNIRIFSEEIPNLINDVVNTITDQLLYLYKGILLIYSESTHGLYIILSSIKTALNIILVIFSEVVLIIKGAIVLSGNTVWLILTFLPVHLPYLLQVVLNYIGNIVYSIVVDSYMALLEFTNFLTDVPLESFLGIAIAIVVGRLCVHFRTMLLTQISELYWLVVRKILYLYYTVYNYMMDSEVRVIRHMANSQDVADQENNIISNEPDDANNADTLCIICQERQKCVLTLPCRHVCLCTECCRRLYGYQRTCPICRTFIYHSVTVYL